MAATALPAMISAEQVAATLTMEHAIDVTRKALIALSSGTAVQPVRTVFPLPQDTPGVLACMPSYYSGDSDGEQICGVKTITVFPGNTGTELSSHQGCVILFEARAGRMLALVDAHEVTAIRTAAASAVATRLLAREEASVLCILGTGVQAGKHLAAISAIRRISDVRIWGRNFEKAERMSRDLSQIGGVTVRAVTSAEEAVHEADIVCTLTCAKAPILKGSWLKPGCHVNAVGACTPWNRELDDDCVTKFKLYVDTRDACVREPGDIVTPMQEGKEVNIIGEVGQVLIGQASGRTSPEDITIFKSVGAAVEDLFSAAFVYRRTQSCS